MKLIKKILYPIILLMSLLALSACGKNESTTTDEADIFDGKIIEDYANGRCTDNSIDLSDGTHLEGKYTIKYKDDNLVSIDLTGDCFWVQDNSIYLICNTLQHALGDYAVIKFLN